ncbi:predicted protein [Naegleria gruberi]|uniref:Predicted protein n=1 Tax=Naegleria gruberi TaxID=5762 RepID=D2VT63_NAEGR|nr:uncharacterized protein NAEGRDRAFT_72187 [Naegleria gruberi]EFC40092.1 predicted protein [Naegleria gruberi]|eukprot:XP_002672836.1 predicted protein [Naegleria gruberi strain NEG-M]
MQQFDEEIPVKILLSDAPLGSFWLRKKYLSIDYRRLEIYKTILFENLINCRGGLQTLVKAISSDRDWMFKVVKKKGIALKYADENIRRDASLVYEAICNEKTAISFMDKSLQSNKQLFMKLVKIDGWLLKYADVKLRADRELVLEAVRNNCKVVDYVTDKALITNDIEIVKYLVSSINSLDCYDLEMDKKAILKVLSNNPVLISQCKDVVKWREIILEAVQLHSQIFTYLVYVDQRLQSDKEIVMNYLKAFPEKLLDIDSQLYYDRDFLLSVVKVQPNILNYLDFERKNDGYLMREMVKANPRALQYCLFDQDEELYLEAIMSDPLSVYPLISAKLKHSRQFHLKLAEMCPNAYFSFPTQFQKDREIILTIISKSHHLFYKYKEFQDDTEIIQALLSKSLSYLSEFPKYISTIKDRSLLLNAIKVNPTVFPHIDPSIKGDVKFISECMAANAMVYQHLPKSMKSKKDIMKKCIERNHQVLGLIRDTYWDDVDFVLECCGYSHLCYNRIKGQ